MAEATTLVLSVGGSPRPLARAIDMLRPGRVVFVVSEPVGDTPGSRLMVEGDGQTAGLAHHAACPADTRIVEVPADDLDIGLARIDEAITQERIAGRDVIVDYTGGTKSMTAAMVLAAAGHEGVRLQFMAGQRADLVRVRDGTEQPVEMPRDLLGMGQAFDAARGLVNRWQYGPAQDVISRLATNVEAGIHARMPRGWALRLEDWRGWLGVFAHWDRFDHDTAWRLLAQALEEGAVWAESLESEGWARRLQALAEAGRRPDPLLVEDLWLNAQRRAANGLFDDAIARLYRLGEAAAQARLYRKHGIDARQAPRQQLKALIGEARLAELAAHLHPVGRSGHVSLSGEGARLLLAMLDETDALFTAWEAASGGRNPEWQRLRNRSTLAHGFRPLTKRDWQEARAWVEKLQGVMWQELLGRPTDRQLPNQIPEFAP